MPDHAGFIFAAYGVTGLALASTVLAVILDYRAQRRAVARLSAGAREARAEGDRG